MFKINRFCKKLLALTLAVCCMTGMTACSRPKEENADNRQGGQNDETKQDTVYRAEICQIEASGISNVIVSGDTLYFTAGERKEESGEYRQTVCRLKIGETVPEVLPITLEPNVYVSSMQLDADGSLLMLLCRPDSEGDRTSYFLNRCKADGTETVSFDITSLVKDEAPFAIRYMAQDGQGNICLCGGEEDTVWILDHEGKKKGELENGDRVSGMLTLPDQKAAIACQDAAGKSVLCEIDAESGKFGKTYSHLPDVCSRFAAGGENTILIMGNNRIYEYDILTETSTELLNLLDCDIDGNDVADISMLEDGSLLAVLAGWSAEGQETKLARLTRKEASEEGQEEAKETIILGTVELTSDVEEQVLLFNRQNEKYRVEIKEYGDGDIEAGKMRLNAEITAGGGPDLLDMTYFSESIDTYIQKGVLEDLNPYLDADGEIKREDYVEKVLNAYEKEGKLYCIVPSFMLYTVVGKTSDVGSRPGWTIDDVMSVMASKPEGAELFRNCTKSQVLHYCCLMSMDCFVDQETGECRFDDGYFEKVLAFADTFPKEETDQEDDIHTRIQKGMVLVEEAAIGKVSGYQILRQLFEEQITPIGFPVKEGSGSFIMTNREFGINTNSKVKEGAWEFLRIFLLEEYQKGEASFVFPILQSALDEQFEEACTPKYEEKDGVQVEVPKTSANYAGWEMEIYAATKEQVEEIRTLIELSDGIYSYPVEIADIIKEETAPFFEGQKSAKEASEIIQSRVQIYVNENL